MADVKKITKREYFAAIREMVINTEINGDISVDQAVEFIDAQVAQLEAKAVKAKERAAGKKIEGDELRAKVLTCVTADWQTGEQITAALGDADVTKAKVTARLTQLCKTGEVVKELQKVGDRKVMCYILGSVDAE